MEVDTVWRHIDEQRSTLADLLEGLPPASWEVPSLCAGWTVRDVAAHLAMAQVGLREVLPVLVRNRFSYDVMIRETAVHLPASHDEIVARLRGFVGSRRTAPFVSPMEPLLDVLVHTQDICVPLGIDRPMPPDAAAASADRVLVLNRWPGIRLRPPLRNVRLVATDTGWVWGEGQVVQGEMRWLLLAVAGRPTALTRLEGSTAALAW